MCVLQGRGAQDKHSHSLHCGRSRRALVRVVPYGSLYRVEWPGGTFSKPANLTRCRHAAREWAEQKVLSESRKLPIARRLKSLDNFWWSSSPIENATGTLVVGHRPDQSLTGE